ncbi:essential protein-like protein Yae1 [Venturia nashicola]|uniref:Protein YAE1 n=1 Tax=Venturia nashicola TaxID=86259 RepID=A0A4Z1NM79_9PEZI|nr:essential protein-like protein Yae1 [Venturia nashicola]
MFLDNQSSFSSSPAPAPIPITANHVTTTNDMFDDIFIASPPPPSRLPLHSEPTTDALADTLENAHLQERSDIQRLRSQHSTAGYREGITTSKASFMQEGFDEGYMLGAELGMRAGWIIGALEGVVRGGQGVDRVKVLLKEARQELSIKGLYAPEYFGQDGVWTYDIGDKFGEQEDERQLDFRMVAAAHPLIEKWMGVVEVLAKDADLILRK